MKHDPLTKVMLAWAGSLALGAVALINAVLAVMCLLGGYTLGALGFGVLAAIEYAAGYLLYHQVRTTFVPFACGLTGVGVAVWSIWTKRISMFDVIIVACAAFAAWVWSRLPIGDPAAPG